MTTPNIDLSCQSPSPALPERRCAEANSLGPCVLAFPSALLGILAYLLWIFAGLPVPLVALIGVVLGFFGVRTARKRPELVSEKWLARGGMWACILNLLLIVANLLVTDTSHKQFG